MTSPLTPVRGRLSDAQQKVLLQAIKSNRVVHNERTNQSYLATYDVIAHLNRVFGFGGWDQEIVQGPALVFESQRGQGGNWDVCYQAQVRLTVYDRQGNVLKVSEESASDTASNQSTRGAAHHQASTSAVSTSLKRAARALGDQFGLSLYNKGSVAALVRQLVTDDGELAQSGAPAPEPQSRMNPHPPPSPVTNEPPGYEDQPWPDEYNDAPPVGAPRQPSSDARQRVAQRTAGSTPQNRDGNGATPKMYSKVWALKMALGWSKDELLDHIAMTQGLQVGDHKTLDFEQTSALIKSMEAIQNGEEPQVQATGGETAGGYGFDQEPF